MPGLPASLFTANAMAVSKPALSRATCDGSTTGATMSGHRDRVALGLQERRGRRIGCDEGYRHRLVLDVEPGVGCLRWVHEAAKERAKEALTAGSRRSCRRR